MLILIIHSPAAYYRTVLGRRAYRFRKQTADLFVTTGTVLCFCLMFYDFSLGTGISITSAV